MSNRGRYRPHRVHLEIERDGRFRAACGAGNGALTVRTHALVNCGHCRRKLQRPEWRKGPQNKA